ncbi:hypothetical protein [Streptomyces sp. NPDC005752]|uniref:hypothetical protein n=1 Tax=Streptomyces sp. NPDC005752 TaxID=3157065 RepID=UPI0033C7C7E3
MNELPIVVTCTDRKTSPPTPALQARTLPAGDLLQRAAEWARRLQGADNRPTALQDLYQGDQWKRALALTDAATRAGFAPRLYAASAGLGLRPVSSLAPSYAATFLPRHADSVTSSSHEASLWWECLQQLDGAHDLSHVATVAGRVLVVVSGTYAHAMQHDLRRLAATGAETVLIGGACEVEGILRVPANADLRQALGGTLTSLNTRTAASWLEHCTPGRLISPQAQASWGAWAAQAARPESYARTPVPDGTVIAFIKEMKSIYPDSSRTRLLRLFRDKGMACEQKRFADLYTSTIGR